MGRSLNGKKKGKSRQPEKNKAKQGKPDLLARDTVPRQPMKEKGGEKGKAHKGNKTIQSRLRGSAYIHPKKSIDAKELKKAKERKQLLAVNLAERNLRALRGKTPLRRTNKFQKRGSKVPKKCRVQLAGCIGKRLEASAYSRGDSVGNAGSSRKKTKGSNGPSRGGHHGQRCATLRTGFE